jgi:hypothetical protein
VFADDEYTRAVLGLLNRLEAAGDISGADRRLLGDEWRSGRSAEEAGEDADYWCLRLVRDLAWALGARDLMNIDREIYALEEQFASELRATLDRR